MLVLAVMVYMLKYAQMGGDPLLGSARIIARILLYDHLSRSVGKCSFPTLN